jgi:RNA methyltransferase, TrmH family
VAETDPITERFRAARADPGLAVLEGLHAVKHALRFGAEPLELVASAAVDAERLAEELAPDVLDQVRAAERIPAAVFATLAPRPPDTGVIALAPRPAVSAGDVLAAPGPVVLLENPRNLANLGASVRVAAAADAGGVLVTGSHDPWHPEALRGSAGLHYALPVARLERLTALGGERPLVALDPGGEALGGEDPGGEPLPSDRLPPDAILAFGSERHGLSAELLARADARVRIPMRAGISSLNLATAVAAVLFARRL